MKSLYDAVKATAAIVPAVYTTTQTSAAIDTAGFNTAIVVVNAGDIDLTTGDETYSFKVQSCATSGGSYADVTGATTTITADNQVKKIRVEGIGTTVLQYIKVVATLAGTTPSWPGSAVVLLGHAYTNPQA